MTSFSQTDDLQGARFTGVNLRGARFVESDLSGIVMRGVEIRDAEIDAPWLSDGETFFRVNGVDVISYVESELDRRFPGRADRRATDPEGLRSAWAALEKAWAATLDRVATLPPETVDISVDGEWSFAQTLRHLVYATDLWLIRGALALDEAPHPIGQVDAATEGDTTDQSVDPSGTPSFAEVLEVRAGRVARVRDLLATVTEDRLAETVPNPHDPERQETVRSCLHVILEEEWEHLRFALRDLDLIAARSTDS